MMNAVVNDRKARVEDSHKMARPDFDFFHQPCTKSYNLLILTEHP
jgi:hypothetical protein